MNIESRLAKLEEMLKAPDDLIVLTPDEYAQKKAQGWEPPDGTFVMVPEQIKKPGNAGR